MNTDSTNVTLLETIRQGLSLSMAKETEDTLGDRSKYAGLSDIAKYSECPRAAIAAKLAFPNQALKSVITLQRGHWFEKGIADAFSSLGLNALQQLEMSIQDNGVLLKAHLDFTLVWETPNPAVRIVEIKSTEKIPDTPRDAHRFQAQAQICLLAEYWNQPVFSLADTDENRILQNLTFPELCHRYFGINLPQVSTEISMESWLLYISMCNAREFGPYLNNGEFLSQILRMAKDYWAMKTACVGNPPALKEIDYAKGFYPLCSWCEFSNDCPKFTDEASLPQWEAALDKLDVLKLQKADIDKEIRETEDALKQVYQHLRTNDWLLSGKHRFRVSEVKGRQSLDLALVRDELDCLFDNYDIQDCADDLLNRCAKVGAPYERLVINQIN